MRLHQGLVGSDGGTAERGRLLELVGLADVGERKVDQMSKGMQQRLGIAQAMIGAPRFLVLDEPTSALDPAGRRTVRALLEELRSRGVSVLLNSHLLSEVELVCDRVVIITRGKVVAQGRPDELTHASGVLVETDAGERRYDIGRDEVPTWSPGSWRAASGSTAFGSSARRSKRRTSRPSRAGRSDGRRRHRHCDGARVHPAEGVRRGRRPDRPLPRPLHARHGDGLPPRGSRRRATPSTSPSLRARPCSASRCSRHSSSAPSWPSS